MYCFLLNRLLTFHWQAFGEYFLKHFLIENDYGIVSENAGYPSPSNPASSPALTACVCVCGWVWVCTCVHLFVSYSVAPQTVAHKALVSMEISRQEYCSGFSVPLPDPLIELVSLTSPELAGGFFPLAPSILYVIDAQTELGEEKQAQKIMPWGSISLAFITCMVF